MRLWTASLSEKPLEDSVARADSLAAASRLLPASGRDGSTHTALWACLGLPGNPRGIPDRKLRKEKEKQKAPVTRGPCIVAELNMLACGLLLRPTVMINYARAYGRSLLHGFPTFLQAWGEENKPYTVELAAPLVLRMERLGQDRARTFTCSTVSLVHQPQHRKKIGLMSYTLKITVLVCCFRSYAQKLGLKLFFFQCIWRGEKQTNKSCCRLGQRTGISKVGWSHTPT